MSTVDEATRAARRLGRSAALRNTGLESCPYPFGGSDVERAAARAWVRMYLHMRPQAQIPVDLSDEWLAVAHAEDDGPGTEDDGPGVDG